MFRRFLHRPWHSPLGWLLLAALCALALVETRQDVISTDVGVYAAMNSAPHTRTSATLTAALTDMGSTRRRLLLSRGAWSLTTDHTVPATAPLVIPEGTTVTLAANKTLTLASCPVIEASPGWLTAGSNAKVNITAAGCPIETHKFATAGAGSAASPWTGWDTALTWAANRTYEFYGGTYAYTATLQWALTGLRVIGHGNPILQFNGSGAAITLDGTTGTFGFINNVHMENVTINGTASTTYGIYAKDLFRSTFQRMRLRNIADTVFRCDYCVLVTLDNFIFSVNEGGPDDIALTVFPKDGIVLTGDGTAGHISSANSLLGCMMEGMKGTVPNPERGRGLYLDMAQQTYVHGGTYEHNWHGIVTSANSQYNQIYEVDVEANSPTIDVGTGLPDYAGDSQDILEGGTDNQYIGTFGGLKAIAVSGAKGAKFLGGKYWDLVLNFGVLSVDISHASIQHCVTDNSGGTGVGAPGVLRMHSNRFTGANAWVDTGCVPEPLVGNQGYDRLGNTMVEAQLVVKPATTVAANMAIPPSYAEPFHVIGTSQSSSSERGIFHIWNKDNLRQHIYMGIAASEGPGTLYIGGVNDNGGFPAAATAMRMFLQPTSPSAVKLSECAQADLAGLNVTAGYTCWCNTCMKATDPCASGGQGAYAQKDGTGAWRCP